MDDEGRTEITRRLERGGVALMVSERFLTDMTLFFTDGFLSVNLSEYNLLSEDFDSWMIRGREDCVGELFEGAEIAERGGNAGAS